MTTERPFITLPSDQPSYETLTDLTMEQKAALPARFHTPVWTDSTPGAFICTVCWVEGEMVSWPCQPALSRGWDLFDDPRRVIPVSEVPSVDRYYMQWDHREPHEIGSWCNAADFTPLTEVPAASGGGS
jgi:hypothetical protein